jgi:DNA-binding PadR family transcriptional regulator
MTPTLGLNEALILTTMSSGDELGIAEIVTRLEDLDSGREIREATVYVALQRMGQRKLVVARKERVISRDGRPREVGAYKISADGLRAVRQFARETAPTRKVLEVPVAT